MEKVAQKIAGELAEEGVKYVFGLAGESVVHLMDAIRREPRLTYIGVRNEAAAGFMASAYAKVTGHLGACLADAGPGSLNLLTGIYDASLDRVPVLALIGEVDSKSAGIHWPQDATESISFADATVYNHTLHAPEMARSAVVTAIRRALAVGGVSRLGLPKDLQGQDAATREVPRGSRGEFPEPAGNPDPGAVAMALKRLEEAERPVFFVGRGAVGAETLVEKLADTYDAGIVHTIPAFGLIPSDHPRNLGVAGQAGTTAAATALREADLVLVIGSSWWQPEYLSPRVTFIQVEARPDRIGMTFPADVGLVGDAAVILGAIDSGSSPRKRPVWSKRLDQFKRHYKGEMEPPAVDGGGVLHPLEAVRAISRATEVGSIVSLDVGEGTCWFGRGFQADGQRVLISGHWRAMGWALPAALAAKLANPGRQVVAVTGDGGFALSMAELATAVQHQIPVTVVVLENGTLAEEKHNQTRMKLPPYGVSLHNPDYALYAESCGATGHRVANARELEEVLAQSRHSSGPVVIVAPVAPEPFSRPPTVH